MANVTIKRRIICSIYESILLFGIIFMGALIYGIIFKQKNAMHYRLGLQLSIFIFIGIYFIYCWCATGQTLAMKTWGLKLQTIEGNLLNFKQAVLRYILFYILWILPSLILGKILNMPKYYLYLILINICCNWIYIKFNFINQQSLHDKILKLEIIKIDFLH